MNVTVLYVGSSLLAPLKNAEREINRAHKFDLRVAAYNFGSPLNDGEWQDVENDLQEANVVFVIHVMDGENASRLINALEKYRHDAVVVINCMPELMRRTRMGKLDVGSFAGWMARYARRDKSTRARNGHGHYLNLIRRLPRILKFVPTAGALT
ncbi:MAG TPA: DUF3479 domain-containing protein, partial [Pyrinomonadaceae bacterium]|nr:DUF3479 domain-containing protein [Pyrinomonadaceae bacterium]